MFRQHLTIGRRARGMVITAAVITLVTAVAVGTSSGARTATPTIAFVSQGTSNSWAAQLDAVARATANRLGAKLVYYNGQGDATKQLPELQTAIATHPDAMVVVPLGQAADTGPVERAMSAGIPVILCDSKINSDKYTSLVNPNPATATVPLAEWLAKKMHYKGDLLYIGGLPGNGTTILYDQGFHQVMNKYKNIHSSTAATPTIRSAPRSSWPRRRSPRARSSPARGVSAARPSPASCRRMSTRV